MTALKMLGEGRVGGYLVNWGSPSQKDLTGEFFTPQTELGLDWYTQRPMLYHHGLDGSVKSTVIGVIDTLKTDQVGVWAEAQLNMRNQYVEQVLKLIQKGILGWSSGSLPHLVEVAGNGEIKRWPICEGSATPTPAEPRRTGIATIKSAFASLGLDITRLNEQDATAENTATENAPSLKELCAKADVTLIESDVTAEDENAARKALEPIENKDTAGGVTVDIQSIIASVLQAITASGVQLTPEQETAITQAVTAACGADTAMASNMTGMIPAEQIPAVAKSVGQLVAAEVVKINVQKELVATAAKTAMVNALAGQGGQSRVPAFSPTPEQVAPPVKETSPANHISLKTKFDDMKPEDMSYYIQFRNAVRSKNGMPGWMPDQEFLKEFADKAGKSFEAGQIKFGDHEETKHAIKSLNAIKSDELNYSTLASGGDEWVPNMWASQVWELARMDNVVLPQFKNVEMPSNPYELPVQSTDPSVSLVGETVNESQLLLSTSSSPIPDSKVTTAKVTLSAKKLALRAMFSAELDEDSIIPWVSDLREQGIRSLEDSIDNVLLNGDTDATASTNINLIDGTPAATAKYLAFNGLRKLPIITTTANKFSAGGGLISLSQIRQARFSLSRAYSVRLQDLFILTHTEQYAKLLGLSEFITVDKYGPQATAVTGELGKVDGMPVLVSNEYALTDSAGKIPAAGGTLGSLLVVYKPGWIVGYRRRINSTIKFFEEYDSYQMVATVRLAFINRDAEVAGMVYNSLV